MTDENNAPQRKAGGVTGKGFQKGVSGNPGGRPAGQAEFTALMRANSPEAARKLAAAVADGKPWAIELTLAYAWGKPTQRNEHTGADGGPIQTQQVEDTRAPIDELIAGALAKVEQKETRH